MIRMLYKIEFSNTSVILKMTFRCVIVIQLFQKESKHCYFIMKAILLRQKFATCFEQ